MKKSTIIKLIRLAIVFVGILGFCICSFWYPNQIADFNLSAEIINTISFRTQLVFYLLTAIPCFAVLVIGWSLTGDIKENNEFTYNTAKKFKNVFYLMFADSCIFLIGNIIFIILKWSVFGFLYVAMGIIGLILAFFAYVISVYIERASKIQEENDSII